MAKSPEVGLRPNIISDILPHGNVSGVPGHVKWNPGQRNAVMELAATDAFKTRFAKGNTVYVQANAEGGPVVVGAIRHDTSDPGYQTDVDSVYGAMAERDIKDIWHLAMIDTGQKPKENHK